MKRNDIVLVLLLLGAAIVGFGAWALVGAARQPVLVIRDRTGEIYRERLDVAGGPITVSGPVGESVIEVSGNQVRMLSSDCPDKICIHMGWISKPGQVIVCMPNRVIITLEEGGR